MRIVAATSLVGLLLLMGHDDTNVCSFQVSPGTTTTTATKRQNRLPRLDYTMDAYDAMYKMYFNEPKDVGPVRPADSEQRQRHETPTVSSTRTSMAEASASVFTVDGNQQTQSSPQGHAVLQAATGRDAHQEQMSASIQAASVEHTKQFLAVQTKIRAQQEQFAASMQAAMNAQNKRLSASVQQAARSLAEVLDSLSRIEKGVPPSIIQGAALATFSLSLVTTRDLTLSGLASATSAYMLITPGLIGNAMRSVGEKVTTGLQEASALLNHAVAAARATNWEIEKIRNAGSSFLVKYVKNIHKQVAKLMPFLFKPPIDEQEGFGVKENQVAELFFANETSAFDTDFFFAAQVATNGAPPTGLSKATGLHESDMTQEILLRLIEDYVQEAEDILAGLKAEEEMTPQEYASTTHGETKRDMLASTPAMSVGTATRQKETTGNTPIQSVDTMWTSAASTTVPNEDEQNLAGQAVDDARKHSTTSLTQVAEFGSPVQPVQATSFAQAVSNRSWKYASENLLPNVENIVATSHHDVSVPLGHNHDGAHTWFPASDVRSSSGYDDFCEGNLREGTRMDDSGSDSGRAESLLEGQVTKSSSSWSTGGYLDNL